MRAGLGITDLMRSLPKGKLITLEFFRIFWNAEMNFAWAIRKLPFEFSFINFLQCVTQKK